MASITSISFDETAYTPGQTITATVDYVPDTPTVNPQTFTFTANVTDSSGNVLTTSSQDFTVNQPQAGDAVQVSDSGGRSWTAGAVSADGNGGENAVFTATA